MEMKIIFTESTDNRVSYVYNKGRLYFVLGIDRKTNKFSVFLYTRRDLAKVKALEFVYKEK